MKAILRVFICLGVLAVATRCATNGEGEESGSQTHWLGVCNRSSDCRAGLQCSCGLCTKPCIDDAGCGALGKRASCLSPVCSATTTNTCGATCSGDGDCTSVSSGLRCSAGKCVARSRDTVDSGDGAEASSPSDGGGASDARPGSHSAPDGALVCEKLEGVVPTPDARACAALAAGHEDVGTPPSHCIAPCIWELEKYCRPEGACVTEQLSPIVAGRLNTVSCAPKNDWWDLYSYATTTTGMYESTQVVFSENCRCYSASIGTLGNSIGNMFAYWTDGNNQVIAAQEDLPQGPVVCGPFGTVSNILTKFDTDAELPPGYTSYDSDPGNVDCAPWQTPACQPGCCSGTPPEASLTNPGL